MPIGQRLRGLALAVLILASSVLAHAGPIGLANERSSAQLAESFSARYPDIVVDARGSRGGNGDIAAAYLTISDWLMNYDLKSRITVLVDENGKQRLLKLAQGNSSFLKHVEIREPSQGKLTPTSLYLVLANPSGTYRYQSDFDSLIPFKPDATLIVQTVLGNTENANSLHPYATVENGGHLFDWGAAGLAEYESGIYTDDVAKRLRPLSLDEAKQNVLSKSDRIEDAFSRAAVTSVLSGTRLSGAKIGLVYGISSTQTQRQFESYLEGLRVQSGTAHVLLTPSAFRLEAVQNKVLKDSITSISSMDQIPRNAESGRIYVIETKTLPHEVFVGLMAVSMKGGVVPVGAGDGFMSAAIQLGEPFVLTQVPWNRMNIKHIHQRLLALALKHKVAPVDLTLLRGLLDRNFDQSDFRSASALARFAPLFRILRNQIPKLSDRLMEIAIEAPALKDPAKVPRVDDLVLQKSHLAGGRVGKVSAGFSSAQSCEALFK